MVDNSGIEVSIRNQYVHVTHAHIFQIGIVCIHFAWSASYNSMPLSQIPSSVEHDMLTGRVWKK